MELVFKYKKYKAIKTFLDFFHNLSAVRFINFYLAAGLLSACGSTPNNQADNAVDATTNVTQPTPLPPSENNITLVAGEKTLGMSGVNDIISATSETFINGTSVIDTNPYDEDILTIAATNDITGVPTVSGIENIIFSTQSDSLGGDKEFDINLESLDGGSTIKFTNSSSSSLVKTLHLTNAQGKLIVDNHFTNVKLQAKANIDLTTSSDVTVNAQGSFKDLSINGSGKNVTLSASTNLDDVSIINANTVVLNTLATADIEVTSNGNVTINDASKIKGNITITSVGSIDIKNASAALGTLTLNNERALSGSDVTITDANSVGSVSISSAGAITANTNNGLASAKIISAKMAENSIIVADGVSNQTISLTSENKSNETVQIALSASTLETLSIKGTAPIVVEIDGQDVSTETITNSNPNASLYLSGASTDLSNVASSINLWLKNHDGNTLIITDNQKIFFDSEQAQTSSISVPTFDHKVEATNSTTNTLIIKSHDTNKTNSDTVANFAGINFIDVQRLTFDTSSEIALESSANITGIDLKEIIFLGSGGFDIGTKTITGSSTNRVTFDGSNATGAVTITVNSASKGVANVKTGTANDLIKIDGISADTAGFVIASGAGLDTIHLTNSGDGSSAKINLNGGEGADTLKLDSGVDLSASTLTLSSVETIFIQSGGQTQKIAASDISGQSFSLSDYGSGSSTFTIAADQATIDISNLNFESSFISGTDVLAVDGSSSSSGLTVTGSSHSDNITGSNANDILKGGNANDTINGGTGDDIIEGGAGADTLTGGAGDDEFDFISGSSTEALMDKISDFQAAAADGHNDKIDNITGAKGANTASVDVKSAISGGGGGETVTAAVNNGVVTLSGSDAGQINTLAEWIDAVSVDGVIAKAADDADSVGTVCFQFNGHTYVVESNDTFNNNTPNVDIVNVIELTSLTSVTAVAEAAAANTIVVA